MIAALIACLVLAVPLQGLTAPSQSASSTDATQGKAATAIPDATSTATSATSDQHAVALAPIVVTVPKPYIWTFQKGNSKVLVLGMVYPEPKGLTFVPASIHRAIAASGAVIGSPWFHFGANVNVFNVWSIWHAASGAKYLADGKRLSDVLPASDLQQWNALKAQYCGFSSVVIESV